jgi:hypothetical protein
MPQYPKDWHLHNTKEFLYEETRRQLNVVDIDPEIRDFRDGDIILFTYGLAASHSSIYYNEDCWQALNKVGVVKMPLYEISRRTKLTYQLRLVK